MGNGLGASAAVTVPAAVRPAGLPPGAVGPGAGPDGDVARSCAASFRARALNDLRIRLAAASLVVPAAAAPVRARCRGLDPSRRWRPEVFAWHRALVGALEVGVPAAVADTLAGLAALLAGDPYPSDTEVTGLRGDAVDLAAAALLTEVRGGVRHLHPPADAGAGTAAVWAALEVLAEVDPAMRAEFDAVTAEVRLFGGTAADAFTSTRWFGCVYVALPPARSGDALVLHLLDHLTHETSHLGLYARMATDPLLLNGDRDGFRAPIRPDPRPLDGIFHAMFVLARVTRVFARLAAHDARPAVRVVRDEQASLFARALATVEGHALLTDHGRAVVQGCRAMVAEALG